MIISMLCVTTFQNNDKKTIKRRRCTFFYGLCKLFEKRKLVFTCVRPGSNVELRMSPNSIQMNFNKGLP